jgi:hypothetical protein
LTRAFVSDRYRLFLANCQDKSKSNIINKIKDNHLHPIRAQADKSLAELGREFKAVYSRTGRPSIPPEQLPEFSRYLHEQE